MSTRLCAKLCFRRQSGHYVIFNVLCVMLVQYYKLQKQPPEVFCKKGVLRNFAKFTGKNPAPSLFFNKVERLFRTPPDDCFQS